LQQLLAIGINDDIEPFFRIKQMNPLFRDQALARLPKRCMTVASSRLTVGITLIALIGKS
jgi:hypothetical protein